MRADPRRAEEYWERLEVLILLKREKVGLFSSPGMLAMHQRTYHKAHKAFYDHAYAVVPGGGTGPSPAN